MLVQNKPTPHLDPPPEGGRGPSVRMATYVPGAPLESPSPLEGEGWVGGVHGTRKGPTAP